MISVDTLTAYLYNGMAFLRCLNDLTTPLDTILKADDANALSHLIDTYLGNTPFTGRQHRAIAAAETQQHSIDDLLRIEHHVCTLKNQPLAWRLREHLCGTPGEDIDTEAREQLKQLRPTPAPPQLGVKIRRGAYGAPDVLIYRGPSQHVTQLYDYLDCSDIDAALTNLANNSEPNNAEQPYNLGDSRNTTPEAAPHIILTLDNIESLQHGNDDVLLTLTNGARMTGAEWAAARLHEVGFVTLLHPVEGPVNLYRTERFPNTKQRIMAAAESPLCAYPGCRQPASRSHIHHITAWKHGGETNSENLTVLCPYHNGINNDDPGTGGRRIERQEGKVTLV